MSKEILSEKQEYLEQEGHLDNRQNLEHLDDRQNPEHSEDQILYEKFKENTRNLGYYAVTRTAIYTFGDAGMGDTSLGIGPFGPRPADTPLLELELDLYHNQEASLISWLIQTYGQGYSQQEMNDLYGDFMKRIALAERKVRAPEYHHEAYGTDYIGKTAAVGLWRALHMPNHYNPQSTWLDAYTVDAANPGIVMTANHPDRFIDIVDNHQGKSSSIPFEDIPDVAVGLTVYNRGRIRPEVIKDVYAGLLSEDEANEKLYPHH